MNKLLVILIILCSCQKEQAEYLKGKEYDYIFYPNSDIDGIKISEEYSDSLNDYIITISTESNKVPGEAQIETVGKVESYYKNGILASVFFISNGQKVNEIIEYYKSGRIKNRGFYDSGVVEYSGVQLYENAGIKMIEFMYYDGFQERKFFDSLTTMYKTEYYTSGKLDSIYEYTPTQIIIKK